MPERCRVCHCTEADACHGGCEWEAPGLCSTCAMLINSLAAWLQIAGPASYRTGDVVDDSRRLMNLCEHALIALRGEQPLVEVVSESEALQFVRTRSRAAGV